MIWHRWRTGLGMGRWWHLVRPPRQSHELSVLTHRVMRFLIDEHGFRSLALEGDEAASFDLDTYVRTGEGDPLAILARARPFLRLAQILAEIGRASCRERG